jgi:hypothetical protein
MKTNYFLGFLILFLMIGCGPGPTVNIGGEQYYRSGWSLEMERTGYGTYFVDTLECKNKECGKAIFFHKPKHQARRVSIIDFDKKEYSIEILQKEKINKHTYMKPSRENAYKVYHSKTTSNKYNFVEVENPKKQNIYYYVEPFYEKGTFKDTVSAFTSKFFKGMFISEWTLDTNSLDKKGFTFNPNIGIKSTKNYEKDNSALQHFIDINNLYEIMKTYKIKKWYPEKGNNNTNITGKGTIHFKKRDYLLNINGTFNNGKLISNGKIKITRWFSDGNIHFFSPYTDKEVSISPSSDIRQVTVNMYKSLNIEISNTISEMKAKRAKSYSSSSSIEYVMVQAECINGLIPCIEKNLKITGSPGRFEPSYGGANSGTIYKGYNNKIAGRYSFTVTFDKSLCSGSFYLSGTKKNYSINLSKECSDNGSREW